MFDDFKVEFPDSIDDFKVNFPPATTLPYIEEEKLISQSEEIWYNYLIVYEGDYHHGREFKSYNHIITFKDIDKFEEEQEREYYKEYGKTESVIVTNIVLLSFGKKDDTDET